MHGQTSHLFLTTALDTHLKGYFCLPLMILFCLQGRMPSWKKNWIGFGPNNVMPANVIGSSFKSKLALWLRGLSWLPVFVLVLYKWIFLFCWELHSARPLRPVRRSRLARVLASLSVTRSYVMLFPCNFQIHVRFLLMLTSLVLNWLLLNYE